jgi:hypothetical protein
MKQVLLFGFGMMVMGPTMADTPGKATNHPNKVTLQNVAALKDYTLYWHKHYGDTTIIVNADTSLVIPGSGGAPDGADFWGIHKKTNRSTDTLHFDNYYDPDYVVILSGVSQDSIRYNREQLTNANEVVETANKDSIANKQLVIDAEKMQKSHLLKNILLGALAGAALGGLVWFFVRRKKKKQAVATAPDRTPDRPKDDNGASVSA